VYFVQYMVARRDKKVVSVFVRFRAPLRGVRNIFIRIKFYCYQG
jgi:hypothetical protein